jgi:cyclopropane fatty-acyl-phospholipid synthase-like methyltransferase
METKGNKIENWNSQYKELATTYTEKAVTPGELANYIGEQFVYEDLLKYLRDPKNAKTLEIGCGGARTSVYLASKGMNVACSDFAPEAIRLASDNFKVAGAVGSIIQDDFINTKLQPGSFDCVMSFGLLEHFEDINAVFSAATRLVKPGGIQIHAIIPKKFSTHTIMNVLSYPFEFAKRFRNRNFGGIFTKSFRDFPHFESSFSRKEYCSAFEAAGNTILRCEAAGSVYHLINLPLNLGNILVRFFSGAISSVIRLTDRTESGLLHYLSPVIYVICRKK